MNINAHEPYNDDTLLHIAVYHGNEELVKLLLARGAKIDQKNRQERTPLDIALYEKPHANITSLLLTDNHTETKQRDENVDNSSHKKQKLWSHF